MQRRSSTIRRRASTTRNPVDKPDPSDNHNDTAATCTQSSYSDENRHGHAACRANPYKSSPTPGSLETGQTNPETPNTANRQGPAQHKQR